MINICLSLFKRQSAVSNFGARNNITGLNPEIEMAEIDEKRISPVETTAYIIHDVGINSLERGEDVQTSLLFTQLPFSEISIAEMSEGTLQEAVPRNDYNVDRISSSLDRYLMRATRRDPNAGNLVLHERFPEERSRAIIRLEVSENLSCRSVKRISL